MINIQSNSVKKNYSKALEWLSEQGFIPDNFIAFAVQPSEMIMLHTIINRFFTPFAPITKGIYSIWQKIAKEISSGKKGGILETVIFGNPAYIYNIAQWGTLSDFEQQAIWVHGFFHIYQNHVWFKETYQPRLQTIVEVDQRNRARLETQSRNSNEDEPMDQGLGQIFVSVLNLLAASCPEYVWNFSGIHPKMTQMYEIFQDLKTKYVEIFSLPLNQILVEGTATDIQMKFLNQNASQNHIFSLDKLPPAYHFGAVISLQLRQKLSNEWSNSLKNCQDDIDFLQLFIKYNTDSLLNSIYEEVKVKYCVSHTDHWRNFENYYSILKPFLNIPISCLSPEIRPSNRQLIPPPLQLLYIDQDLVILIQSIPFLAHSEILLLSYFLSKNEEIPLFPHVILLSHNKPIHVVAVKHRNSVHTFENFYKNLETMYEVSYEFNSPDSSLDQRIKNNDVIKELLKLKKQNLELELEDYELNYIFQAIKWLDL